MEMFNHMERMPRTRRQATGTRPRLRASLLAAALDRAQPLVDAVDPRLQVADLLLDLVEEVPPRGGGRGGHAQRLGSLGEEDVSRPGRRWDHALPRSLQGAGPDRTSHRRRSGAYSSSSNSFKAFSTSSGGSSPGGSSSSSSDRLLPSLFRRRNSFTRPRATAPRMIRTNRKTHHAGEPSFSPGGGGGRRTVISTVSVPLRPPMSSTTSVTTYVPVRLNRNVGVGPASSVVVPLYVKVHLYETIP